MGVHEILPPFTHIPVWHDPWMIGPKSQVALQTGSNAGASKPAAAQQHISVLHEADLASCRQHAGSLPSESALPVAAGDSASTAGTGRWWM